MWRETRGGRVGRCGASLLLFLAILVGGGHVLAEEELSPGWEVFARGARLHGANGLGVDAAGMLHVASGFGNEIVVVDPRTGVILERLGPADGVVSPDDLFIEEDGTLFATAIMTGQVLRRETDGSWRRQFVAPGVNPVTCSDDGRLFVALDFFGDGLFELDPWLVDPPRCIVRGGLGWLNGMDVGPDGALYGPLQALGLVVRIDPDSCDDSSDPWNDCDIRVLAGGLSNPVAAKFGPDGALYAIDAGTIWRIDPMTGARSVYAVLVPGLDNLVFDDEGRLFVSSNRDGFVIEVLPGNRQRVVLRAGMTMPGGLALDGASTRLLLADTWSLRSFDPKNGRRIAVESMGFAGAVTAASDGDRLVLSSFYENSVRIVDLATGATLARDQGFKIPLNAIPYGDDIVVAELGTGSIVRMSDHSVLASGFYVPTGLVAREGVLYAADWASGTLWRVARDGQALPAPEFVLGGLAEPEGLAVDVDGSLLIVESGRGTLTRFDPVTGRRTTVGHGFAMDLAPMPNVSPAGAFSDVAVAADGTLFVSGDAGRRIYVMRP